MVILWVNGKQRHTNEPMDISSFLEANGINSPYVAVAHNGVVIRREEFAQITLQEGDALEIVSPVGGG